tara:strand:- start:269 stop:904 length:636 start_codon:yes stop_codon:yes gene_type:complete
MPKLIEKKVIQDAITLMATDPDLTNLEVAKKVGVSVDTIAKWKKDPKFVDAFYDSYMVSFGNEIPSVLQAMINQAKAGNVQAGRLVLEHSGKLVKNINVTIDSPFEKFLKSERTEVEYQDAEVLDIVDSVDDIQDVVVKEQPKQHPRKQKRQEILDIKKEVKKIKRSKARKEMYQLKKRAEKVGVPQLRKKPNALEKQEWINEIEKREAEC